MRQWFNSLKQQQQLLVLCLVGVLIVYILVVLIWRPMSSSVSTLEKQNESAQQSLLQVKALAAEYKVLEKSSGSNSPSRQNLTRLIDTTVKSHTLKMTRFQPSSSGDVQVRFDNAAYERVIAWMNELEAKHSVLIKDLSMTTGSSSGLVNVSVRMRQRG